MTYIISSFGVRGMSKYTITIEGDFEKGECGKCPLTYKTPPDKVKWVVRCALCKYNKGCPLEEVTDTNVGEIKQGEWFLLDECSNSGVYCSVCHKKVYKEKYANQKLMSNFCPNCGADMRGVVNE